MKALLGVIVVLGVPGLLVAYYIWDLKKRNRKQREALAALPPEQREAVEKEARAAVRSKGLATAILGLTLAVIGGWTTMNASEHGGTAFYGMLVVGVAMLVGGAAQYLTGKKV